MKPRTMKIWKIQKLIRIFLSITGPLEKAFDLLHAPVVFQSSFGFTFSKYKNFKLLNSDQSSVKVYWIPKAADFWWKYHHQ